MKELYYLNNPVKNYSWGPINGLVPFTEEDDRPQAELWLGAHHLGESVVINGKNKITLSKFMKQNAILKDTAGLSFLLKVLAVDGPTALFLHPNKSQARVNFGQNKLFVDNNGKDKLICAIDNFSLLAGIKEAKQLYQSFTGCHSQALSHELAALSGQLNEEGVKTFITGLFKLETKRLNRFIDEVLANPHNELLCSYIEHLSRLYPNSIAALAPLYLNLFTLQAGEALYLTAGQPQLYLNGLALELGDNSDNQLTFSKDELTFSCLNFAQPKPLSADDDSFYHFDATKTFKLQRLQLDTDYFINAKNSAQIMVCTKGKARLTMVKGNKAGQNDSYLIKRG